ncbi:MAG TPA: hypothetical protein PJ982_07425, partial [Lacipirellulaceae bacterium]|nr:hypothetical protein [Lacipirellulaceae bacterium]
TIDADGRIRVRSASLFRGYWGGESKTSAGANGFVTSDLGRIDECGRLHVLGRADGWITTGGEKVDPGVVENAIRAAGLATEFLVKRFVEDLRPAWLFRRLPRGEQWNMLYKYRTGQFDPMLRKYLKSTQLEQMYVPMNAITVDLISGRDVVRSRGDAVDGILESINLPLLSAPINRDGESLVDGGLINNVPANVLAARGCNFVIAVSVTAKMETEFAQNRPDTPASRMRRASTIQTLLRSFLVQSHSINSIGVQTADFIIEPDVTRFELSEFGRAADLADVGDVATEAALPQLKAMLHRVDPELFSMTAAPQVDQL